MRFGQVCGANGGCAGAHARMAAVIGLLAVAALATGCGSDDEARSEERPPVRINISVNLDEERITASPERFGAGPITFLVANESGAAQTLTVDGPRLRRSLGPINPEDTATLQLTAQPGEYTISAAESAGLREATLQVGPERPSAQNELLLP